MLLALLVQLVQLDHRETKALSDLLVQLVLLALLVPPEPLALPDLKDLLALPDCLVNLALPAPLAQPVQPEPLALLDRLVLLDRPALPALLALRVIRVSLDQKAHWPTASVTATLAITSVKMVSRNIRVSSSGPKTVRTCSYSASMQLSLVHNG